MIRVPVEVERNIKNVAENKMNSLDLLEEKTILFKRYKELSIVQENFLKREDYENLQKVGSEKEVIVKQIEELDLKLVKEEIDQSSLEPLIKEVLALEERMSIEASKLQKGVTAESSKLRQGQRAIKQYLQM